MYRTLKNTPWWTFLSDCFPSCFHARRRAPSTYGRHRTRHWDVEGLEPRMLLTDFSVQHDHTLVVTTPIIQPGSTGFTGNPVTVGVTANVQHGALTFNTDGSFDYAPDPGYVGADGFSYLVDDGMVGNSPVSVSLLVYNMAPSLNPTVTSYSFTHDTTLTGMTGSLLQDATDPDGDSLSAYEVSGVGHGSLTIYGNGAFTYTPDQNFAGIDSFSYAVDDGFDDSAPVTITLYVMNMAPTVSDSQASLYVNAQTSLNVLTNATDSDGDALTLVSVTSQSAQGQVTFDAAGNVTYTAGAAAGVDSFVCTVSDGVTTSTANLNVTVNYYAAPTISLNVAYGTGTTVTLSGTVTDDQPGSHTVSFSGAVTGSVTAQSNGTFSFTTQASCLGAVFAHTQDASGIGSNYAENVVYSMPPLITSFSCVQSSGGFWDFTGMVQDEDAVGLTVTFGGALTGNSVLVLSTGSFTLTVQIAANGQGVSAQVTDLWGLQSDQVYTYLI